MAGLLGLEYGSGKCIKPFLHEGGNAVAHWSGASVKFEGGSGKETAARKNLALGIREPAVIESPQPGQSFLSSQSRCCDLLDEDLPGGLDSRHLELFF